MQRPNPTQCYAAGSNAIGRFFAVFGRHADKWPPSQQDSFPSNGWIGLDLGASPAETRSETQKLDARVRPYRPTLQK
jgi:hypothetical protein